MTSPHALFALRWLIRDTFCQALASKVFWVMLFATVLCIVFCLGVRIEGGDNLRPEGDFLYHPKTDQPLTGAGDGLGEMQLLFGALRVQLARDRDTQVHMLYVIFASWVAGAGGLLLTLLWTAGFLPEFLQPSSAAVLLTKPLPRWFFLLGKFLGVIAFLTVQALVFFLGTWVALGITTSVWQLGYLAGIPLLVLHFAMIYSFSVLLAVLTRSTMASALGVILFWVVCFGMNYGRHAVAALPILAPDFPPLSPLTAFLVDAGYWLLPKPADFLFCLENALQAGGHMLTLSSLPEFRHAYQAGTLGLEGAVLSGLAFCLVMVGLAGRQLNQLDY